MFLCIVLLLNTVFVKAEVNPVRFSKTLTSNDDDVKQFYYINQNNQIVFTSSNVPYYGKAYTDIFKSMSNEAKKHLGELESFTDIQKKYIEYMKENEYSNPKDETGELSCPYSFYDINKDGIDELIVLGGYINMQIYSIVDGKIEIIACNKYGGDFKIYPDKAVFSWSGGHKDHYYEEYTKIDSLNSSIVAEKKWEVDPRKGKKKKVEYYLNGKEGTKDKYNKKIKNINSGKSISIKELTWYNTEGQEELFS